MEPAHLFTYSDCRQLELQSSSLLRQAAFRTGRSWLTFPKLRPIHLQLVQRRKANNDLWAGRFVDSGKSRPLTGALAPRQGNEKWAWNERTVTTRRGQSLFLFFTAPLSHAPESSSLAHWFISLRRVACRLPQPKL